MTFGEIVRKCRVDRGWSRKHLERVIELRFKDQFSTLTEDGIEAIEVGKSNNPRETTRSMLRRAMPEILEMEAKEITPNYGNPLANSVLSIA